MQMRPFSVSHLTSLFSVLRAKGFQANKERQTVQIFGETNHLLPFPKIETEGKRTLESPLLQKGHIGSCTCNVWHVLFWICRRKKSAAFYCTQKRRKRITLWHSHESFSKQYDFKLWRLLNRGPQWENDMYSKVKKALFQFTDKKKKGSKSGRINSI